MPRKKKSRSLNSMSRSSVLAAEKNHYGDEPDFTDSVEAGCTRLKAFDRSGKPDPGLAHLKSLNWYNACASVSQQKKWLADFAKDSLGAEAKIVAALRKLPDSQVPRSESIHARILSRGGSAFVPEPTQEKIVGEIGRMVADISQQLKKKTAAASPTSSGPSVQDYMQNQADDAFGSIVAPMIDIAFDTKGAKAKNKHELESVLKKAEVSGRVAIKIAQRIQQDIDELQDAIDKKDADLVEAYSFLSKTQKTRVLEVLESLVDACNAVNESRKIARKASKPRKKRKKTAAALLKTFKYKKADTEYSISSIDPMKIVGASGVVTFNTKTRKASYLIASGKDGLNIKGASVVGIDDKECIEKTIRKPFEFIAAVKGKGKRAVSKAFDSINAKNTHTSGKLNAHTVILGVIK